MSRKSSLNSIAGYFEKINEKNKPNFDNKKMFKKNPLGFLNFTIRHGKTPQSYTKDMKSLFETDLIVNQFINQIKEIGSVSNTRSKFKGSRKSIGFSKFDPFTGNKVSSKNILKKLFY